VFSHCSAMHLLRYDGVMSSGWIAPFGISTVRRIRFTRSAGRADQQFGDAGFVVNVIPL